MSPSSKMVLGHLWREHARELAMSAGSLRWSAS